MPTTKRAPSTKRAPARPPFAFVDSYARRQHEQSVAIGAAEWRLTLEQCDGDPTVYITGSRFSVVDDGDSEGRSFTLDLADASELPAILAGLSRLAAKLEKDARAT